jgi:hypothetical protein
VLDVMLVSVCSCFVFLFEFVFFRYAAFGGEVAAFSSELINIYRASNPNGVVMTDDIVAPSLVRKKRFLCSVL